MLKKLINSLKARFLRPMASIEEVPQTSGKRCSDDNDKPAKKLKQADVTQQIQEGNINKKRKVAMLLAYNGKGYYGLQINPGFKTVESDLCKALVAVGLIPQLHADEMQKMAFQRAARTDKGVSAAANVVSLKMLLNVDDLQGKLNEELPAQIRVMAWIRTTQGFNSKNYCDSRTYIYMIPTYAFAPVEETITDAYRASAETIDNVNGILQKFVGTHNFYNFTSRVKADAANAKRYIMSFQCGTPFVRDGVEFVVVSVKGQSFMLHQIRKMIGLTVAIARGYCGLDAIELAWQPEKIDIPIAPSTGLVLDKLHYDGYNKRYGNDGVHEPLDWSSVQEKLDKFKEEHIFSDIIRAEVKDRSMVSWLATLHVHTFSTEPSPYGLMLSKLKEIEKERAAAKQLLLADTATDGVVTDGAATDGVVTDGAATDGVTDGKATDGVVTDKLSEEMEQNTNLTIKIAEGSNVLTNRSEDDKDSDTLSNQIDVDKTANQVKDNVAPDRLVNQESRQSASLSPLHVDSASTVNVDHLTNDSQTSRVPNNDKTDLITDKTVEDNLSCDTAAKLDSAEAKS